MLKYGAYSAYNDGWQIKLHLARRLLTLVPVLIFLSLLILFAEAYSHSPYNFAQLIVRVTAVAMASSILCVGAYGFYRYRLDSSHGL